MSASVTDTIQIIGSGGVTLSPQSTGITEGIKKDITKIMIPVDPEEAETESNKDRTLFLDLMKITNDLNIQGYFCDGDIPGQNVLQIRATIKEWMRTGKLVSITYRGVSNYGERPGTEEAWIIEDCVFDDEETERTAAEEEGNDYMATQIIKEKFTMKLVFGVLSQDYGL